MPALAVVPAPAPRQTLLDVMDNLQALVNSTELVVAEQEQEFLADLQAAKLSAREKIDKVAGFIAQCEAQNAGAAAEIIRLRARQQFFAAATERMEGYVLNVVMRQDPDAKGRYPKLEGNTSSFGAQRNPPSVTITDQATVPASCKTVSVTMPATMWDTMLDSLDVDVCSQVLDAVQPTWAVLKTLVKDAIAAEVPDWKKQLEGRPSVFCEGVPGAAIAAGAFRLVRT
jgi:Siphovirus Gp157